jgi:hypothetical protein
MPQRMKDRLREASINFEYDRDVYLKLRLNTDCTSDALFASKYLCRLFVWWRQIIQKGLYVGS